MFLNSAIKTILYIIGAIIIGRVKETLFALVIWCIIRKQSGGRHAKKDFVCFVISGSAIFFLVMVSSALKLTLKILMKFPQNTVLYSGEIRLVGEKDERG